MKSLYLIGSLRNPNVPDIAKRLQSSLKIEVFSSWFAAGETADDSWRDYEKSMGRTYKEALCGYAARNVFEFDKKHLDRCDAALLVMPSGKSAHLELGYTIGRGKPGFILLDGEPERFDVMLNFATAVVTSVEEAIEVLAWV